MSEEPQCSERGKAQGDGGQEWLRLAQLTAETGSDIAQLLALELRLALANLGRMFILTLAFLPLLILIWLALSTLPAWLLYQYSDSVSFALLLFLAIQILALLSVVLAWLRYRRSLSLPQTRKHLQHLLGAQSDEPPISGP